MDLAACGGMHKQLTGSFAGDTCEAGGGRSCQRMMRGSCMPQLSLATVTGQPASALPASLSRHDSAAKPCLYAWLANVFQV